MAKNIKIITTIVPNGIKDNKLKFSIFLTPRLPDTGKLKDYFEILEWSHFAQKIREYFTKIEKNNLIEIYKKVEKINNNEKILAVGDKIVDLKVNPIFDNPLAAEYEWKSVFPENNFVSGWLINDAKFKISNADFTSKINNAIDDSINDTIKDIRLKIKESEKNYSKHENISAYYAQIQNLRLIQNLLKKDIDNIKNFINASSPNYNLTKFFPEITFDIYQDLKRKLQKQFELIKKQYFDNLEALKAEEEIRALNQANGEFHKKLSIMGKYPDLLRRYGWLWDFEIDLNQVNLENIKGEKFIRFVGFQNLNTSDLIKNQSIGDDLYNEYKEELNILDKKGKPIDSLRIKTDYFENALDKALKEIEFLNTFTFYDLKISNNKPISFIYAHDKNVETVVENTIKDDFIINGCLNPKLLNPTLISTKQLIQKVSDSNSKPVEIESSGISLNIKEWDNIIKNFYQNQPSPSSNAADKSYLIFGHHLDEGFRVDVCGYEGDNQRPSNFNFGTLTSRQSIYKLKNSAFENEYFYQSTNEGWITESAQNAANQNEIIFDEELFRWNGWSLVCPMPGKYDEINTEGISDDTSGLCNEIEVKSIIPNSDKNNSFTWDKNRIVPLRFGKNYCFRLRVADICGNGIITTPKSLDDTWSKPITYLRVERVDTPTIMFEKVKKHKLFPHKKFIANFKGKELTTLVIRSKVENDDFKLISEKGETRCIAPPRVELNFINYHGTFDKLFREYFGNDDILDQVFDKINELHAYKDSITVKDKLLATQEIPKGVIHNDCIEFLHDPVFSGYTFFHAESHTSVSLDAYDSSYFKEKKKKKFGELSQKYAQIKLQNGDNFKIEPQSNNAVTFSLRPGEEIKPDEPNSPSLNNRVLIYCNINKAYLDYFKLYDKNKPDIDWNKVLSNPLKLNLIHAVQKPCLITAEYPQRGKFIPKINVNKVWLSKREVASTTAQLNLYFDVFPCLTTESMSLLVCYDDFVGNRNNDDGYDILKTDKVIKKDIPPICQEEKVYFEQDQFQHFFGDTKHRWVNYRIEAVSKFKQYFDDIKSLPENLYDESFFSVFGEIVHNQTAVATKYKIESDGTVKLNILSTTKPEGLIIDSITPMLRWEKTVNGSNETVKRICDTFRVFFNNDWFSSGEDEKIAVLFDENLHTVSDYTEKIISQFGLDPITKVEKNPNFKIKDNFFVENTKIEKLFRDNILPNPVHKKDENPDLKQEDKLEKDEIKAAIFDVHFDKVKKMWFTDIKLNNDFHLIKDNYMPFVKFAICRYQEHSLKNDNIDCRFSQVSLTDFSQILPQRQIVISDNKVIYSPENQYPAKTFDLKNNEVKSLNALYLIKDNNSDNIIDLGSQNQSVIINSIEINSKKIEIDIQKNKYNRIEEYETYIEPEEQFIIKEENPRNNYTKRLVFYYNF